MADLIAKVAKKKIPASAAPTKSISTQGRSQGSRLASFGRGRGKGYIQPLPPVRNAVSFRQYSSTNSEALPSLASRGAGTTRNSDVVTTSPEASGWDLSNRDMYMLQEIVVETDVVDSTGPDGNRPEEAIQNRLVDDPATRQVVPTGGIWDGSASLSTFVSIGQAADLELSSSKSGDRN